MNSLCPCGNNSPYSICCELFILGKRNPQTAEQLMRSRYTAYVKLAIDYLIETTHISTRKLYSRNEIEKWAKSNKWLKLEIIKSTEYTVEFNAYFVQGLNQPEIHHELSTFTKEDGKWYYVNGE